MYQIIFDGGLNGHGAYGSYQLSAKGKREIKRLHFQSGTNNEAEYKALIAALEDLISRIKKSNHAPKEFEVAVLGDSALVINQVKGAWRVKAFHLVPLRDRAQALLNQFGGHTIDWQPRSQSEEVLGH
jgi:ribonuclease HI